MRWNFEPDRGDIVAAASALPMAAHDGGYGVQGLESARVHERLNRIGVAAE
jgi:hypothetical protein